MLLSRVAERLYWLARYVERVENTARLSKIHSQLMFDLPKSVKLNWYTLVELTSSEDYFDEHYDARTEKNCMWMLLGDRNNSASLISSLWWARENIRTTRDSLPREAWVYINEIYLYVKDNIDDLQVRSRRNALLEKVIRACQAISGMLMGTMADNAAFRFLMLGQLIERADMTSRILDVGGYFAAQEDNPEEVEQYGSILWANILKSIGIYFMYRQTVQIEINGNSVIEFLVYDDKQFRSLKYCSERLYELSSSLPNSRKVLMVIKQLQDLIHQPPEIEAGSSTLHDYLDEIQLAISAIHSVCYQTWFYPEVEAVSDMKNIQ
ncbi:alpha-E domain-containing protein [Hydrogenovibrio kuenenii]|uniref:alpha-E domain-containing protein n=1 Tax=Hydrogenovibrio kuenenii TaxID=63658 RepID=UPI0004B68659|nr:alpha-E domain-containing protein [Hydrogenovibrio kuenenii]